MPVRLTQEPLQVLGAQSPNVRLTQLPVEVLGQNPSINVRLTQLPVEVLGQNPSINVRLTQLPVEVLGSNPNTNVRITQEFIEVLGSISAPNPVLNTFLPLEGPSGATVFIYGSQFTGATDVQFNGTSAASFTVVNDGLITAITPNSFTSGFITVVNPGHTTTSTVKFGQLSHGVETY
jgi:hypothetical protein